MNYSAYPYASPHRGWHEKSFLTIFSHLQYPDCLQRGCLIGGDFK
jgi:hypothetical protein